LETIWFDSLPSTQTYLANQIKTDKLKAPICVAAHMQTEGIGSRGNHWDSVDESLLFSFAINIDNLPQDLKIESASIYFMYIFKELLAKQGSECWLKWPNDIYIKNKKIAGAITTFLKEKNTLICGIGINFSATENFGKCDIKTDKKNLLYKYLSIFTAPPEWKLIFINFEVEFLKTREQGLYKDSLKYPKNATLNSDGSLEIDDKKVFSLR
jgi:BirA family biotin operon repressor/biotin-[acetyl-CoA-carboxylase] ligase